MNNVRSSIRCLLAVFLISCVTPMIFGKHVTAAVQETSLAQLEAKLIKQDDDIEKLFANGPSTLVFPPDRRERLRRWQDELAHLFAAAAATVDEILKLNPPQEDMWRERRETLALYSQPISPPESRKIFGSGEVQKRARLLPSATAAYPPEARAAKAKGQVRLRVVLAADGTVKNIFPMKPVDHGLTEAAMNVAAQLKFQPAIRNGQPVAQFATIVYEFKNGAAKPPYFPAQEFYF